MGLYPIIVAAHVTAVVFLLGGMLAHDRMAGALAGLTHEQRSPTLVALQRLERQVTAPALLTAWAFGLSLAVWGRWLPEPWLLAKLDFVVGVSALQAIQGGRLRRAIRDGRQASGSAAESVALVLAALAIATLAVVKPG